MAHNLTVNANGQHEFFYTGEKPWHGLGQALDAPATAEEALIAANLGWNVEKQTMYLNPTTPIESHMATVRADNQKVLGVVGKDYTVVQNTHAFAFFDSAVGTGEAIYQTAGSINEGKRVFIVAKLPGTIKAVKNDEVEKYLTFINAHDGTMALRMFWTPIRVVCQNTLNAALNRNGFKESIAIRHFGDINNRIRAAQDYLGLAHRYYADFENIVERLVAKQVSNQEVENFLKSCFEVGEDVSTRTKNQMEEVKNLFENDPKNNVEGIRGTAWSLYNAATQYADHEAVAVSKSADKRMSAIMFGSSAKFKQIAMDSALALV